jgi:hypothetical protein
MDDPVREPRTVLEKLEDKHIYYQSECEFWEDKSKQIENDGFTPKSFIQNKVTLYTELKRLTSILIEAETQRSAD